LVGRSFQEVLKVLPKDVKLFSVDDHIHEHPTVWLDRLPARYADAAPRVVELDDGREAWKYEGKLVPIDSGTSLPRPDLPGVRQRPARFDEMRPGCFDPKARLEDMDIDGVWAELGFPQYARFAGHRFYPTNDPELSRLCVRAYNDFVLEEWTPTSPDRLIPLTIIPWWDIEAAVEETYRTANLGSKAIAFSENPTVLGQPSIHNDRWDPLWRAVAEVGLPLCMHIGSSSKMVTSSPEAPVQVAWTASGVSSLLAMADWLWSGVFDRFPAIRIALSEGGAGWVPYALERADKYGESHVEDRRLGSLRLGAGSSERLPSQIFRDHVYVCIVTDKVALSLLDQIGVDNLMWESDFPHLDGMWPHSRSTLEHSMADIPDETAIKIGSTNAQRVFGVGPFGAT
jgi:predicted TIM-barrel fold metal-dependent hydrolase